MSDSVSYRIDLEKRSRTWCALQWALIKKMFAGTKKCPRHWKCLYTIPSAGDYLKVARMYANKHIACIFARDSSSRGARYADLMEVYFMTYYGLLENTVRAMCGMGANVKLYPVAEHSFWPIVLGSEWCMVRKKGKAVNGAALFLGCRDQDEIKELKDKVKHNVWVASNMATNRKAPIAIATSNRADVPHPKSRTVKYGRKTFTETVDEHNVKHYYIGKREVDINRWLVSMGQAKRRVWLDAKNKERSGAVPITGYLE